MYLSEVRLWNFRKYGIKGEPFEKSEPGVSVQFREGLNVLVGENDSGKTAIIDAIRYTLGTQSGEWTHIEDSDFHMEGERAQDLKIECVFRGFSDDEAGRFLEWIGTEKIDGQNCFVLKVRMTARRKEDRIVTDFRAGPDAVGIALDGDARSLLRVTYLKPLRDADAGLTAGRRSRFAQILKAHALFQKRGTDKHRLEEILEAANEDIKKYFRDKGDGQNANKLMRTLKEYVDAFFPQNEPHEPSVGISDADLADILQRLELSLDTNPSGLGSANLLFMAAELLLLQSEENYGLRLALIEELESHLHPQAQLRLIDYLKGQATRGQFILTTHSTTMGSSIPLENLIICKGDSVFPMAPEFTKLQPKDYNFLYRFLDATKANLFFARGVLLVEGDAENLLIPTIAEAIKRPLHRYGVSIVNVGSLAFSPYAHIFHRKDGVLMGIKVAVVTDMDVKPLEWTDDAGISPTAEDVGKGKRDRRQGLAGLVNESVQVFLSPNWSFEYEVSLSPLRNEFYRALLWAEKVTNSKTGVPQESKDEEVDAEVEARSREWSEKWTGDAREAEKVAYAIYKETMLDRRISKAVTAQLFARHLDEVRTGAGAASLRAKLEEAPSLKYLLDAILYVTEPREAAVES